jgi:MFS family permease
LFRYRDFGLLWAAGLISITGDWLLKIALPIYVFQLTSSPAATAGIVAATVGAGLLSGLVAGVYVDRWDRRRVLLRANVLQAAALLPLVAVNAPGEVWVVYVVVAVQASLAQFVGPAEHALLPKTVGERDLPAANSLNALNNNIARLLGPALGGLVAATTGLVGAAVLDATSFVLSAALVGLVKTRTELTTLSSARTGSPVNRLREEVTDGLKVIRRSMILRALFAVVVVTAVGEGVMGSLFAVFVERAFHGGAPEIGWLMSAQAVGGLAGGLVGALIAGRIPPKCLVTLGLVAFGAIDLVIFNYPRRSTGLAPEIALFVLVGMPGALMTAGVMTLLQTEVDDCHRGRVFSAAMVAESAAALVGAAFAATVTGTFGVVNVLTAQGAAYVLAGLAFAALVRRRSAVPLHVVQPDAGVPGAAPPPQPIELAQ